MYNEDDEAIMEMVPDNQYFWYEYDLRSSQSCLELSSLLSLIVSISIPPWK